MLPRPGPWMATFRVVMGFLLAATLVWLLFVMSGLVSAPRVAFFEIGLLAVALAIWLASRSQRGRPARRLAGIAAAALTVAAVSTVAAGRSEAGPSAIGVAPEDRLIAWQPFDRDRAEQLATAGTYVFVDVTADWCFTCKINETLFLETEDVAGAFEQHGVIAMRADWTRRDDSISRYLADFGRYGIPFYVLYRPNREPHVLLGADLEVRDPRPARRLARPDPADRDELAVSGRRRSGRGTVPRPSSTMSSRFRSSRRNGPLCPAP